MFENLAQCLAGVYLGLVGLVLGGDFRRWWLNTDQPGNPDLAMVVMFSLYIGALAVIRWVH